jgi:hypothetical protein
MTRKTDAVGAQTKTLSTKLRPKLNNIETWGEWGLRGFGEWEWRKITN